MDTNVLKTFIAVCEYSGFSAAAKELGYTQSTVSSQIKQLEKELDVRLFDRYYHKINLTEKGVLVLQQARNILKAQAKMLDSLNSAESIEGEIRLSMSSSVCSRYFKNDFLRFHHQYPEIKVEISILLEVISFAVRKEVVQYLSNRGFCRESIQMAVRNTL